MEKFLYTIRVKISVVIPVYNEEKYIAACLDSIFAQIDQPDEVIIVDNNCTDNSMTLAKGYPVRIIKEEKQGMIPARNKGFNSARYEIVARTDADTVVPEDWITKIKKHFQKNHNLVAVTGSGNFLADMSLVRKKTYRQFEKLYHKSFLQIFHHPILVGPNMAIRKSAWMKVRDEVCVEDSIVHEDADLAIHLGYIGTIIFDKNLTVNSSSRRWKRMNASQIEYFYRYLRTLQHHKQSLHGIKTKTQIVGKYLPKPRKVMKKIRSSAAASLRIAKSLTQ